MEEAATIHEMRVARRRLRAATTDGKVGLVPTMGALHDGHLALIRAARASCEAVVVSLFVNPMQFGPNEDFAKYPRTMQRDRALLEAEGVDVLFAPSAEEMVPTGRQTWVDVPAIGARLDGASRHGHFRGVATVVCKLFHIVAPDLAFFGQKDAAQVAVLRAMVRDLDFAVHLTVCPIVRDADGLALSSRNRYLSAEERVMALALSRSLRAVETAVAEGERSVPELRKLLQERLQTGNRVRVDYAEIVDPETLEEVGDLRSGALVAVAAWVGGTRLIDNWIIPAMGDRP